MLTDGRTDDGRKVITIAHSEQSTVMKKSKGLNGDLKPEHKKTINNNRSYLWYSSLYCSKMQDNSLESRG